MKAVVVLVIFLALVFLIARAVRRRPSKNEWKPQVAQMAPLARAPQLPNPEPAPTEALTPTSDDRKRVIIEVGLPGLKIVGESHYQEALEQIVGGRTEESADFEVDVSLIPENDNPYDPNAVAVEIDGETVGYLSKASAKKYRAKFGDHDSEEWPARIVGGWDRGDGDRGNFGVQMVE